MTIIKMMTINIEDKTYTMVNNWFELTIEKWLECFNIVEDEFAMIKLIHILSGIPEEQIEKLPITEYEKIVEMVKYVLSIKDCKLEPLVKIEGKEYGVKLEGLTKGEYEKCFEIKDDINKIDLIAAMVYRPVVKKVKSLKRFNKYIIEPYDEDTILKRAKLFKKNMLMKDAIAASTLLTVKRIELLKKEMTK